MSKMWLPFSPEEEKELLSYDYKIISKDGLFNAERTFDDEELEEFTFIIMKHEGTDVAKIIYCAQVMSSEADDAGGGVFETLAEAISYLQNWTPNAK